MTIHLLDFPHRRQLNVTFYIVFKKPPKSPGGGLHSALRLFVSPLTGGYGGLPLVKGILPIGLFLIT